MTGFSRQPKSAHERIGLVALSATWRQVIQLVDVAAAEHDVVGFEGGHQAYDHVPYIFPPFLPAVAFQPATADIVLVGCLPVRKMA